MSEFLNRVKKQGLLRTFFKGVAKVKSLKRDDVIRRVSDFFPSFLPFYTFPSKEDFQTVEKSFHKEGLKLPDYFVKKERFIEFSNDFGFGDDFYGGKDKPVWTEKVLEHFIAWEMVVRNLKKDELYIDVAAASSPWVKMLNEKGFKAVGIDLNRSYKFPDDPNYLVMDATNTTFKDGSVSGVSLQCAFEMFTGDDDINLIKELGRILKIGGKALVIPLYMNTHYCGFTSKEFRFSRKYHDKGSKLYLREEFKGIPFARDYDVLTLKERVLDTADKNGLEYKIYVLRNGREIHEGVYCHFILELIKR